MERLTTRVEDKVYYSKGKYPPTTLCAEMETHEIRECMKKLAEYEDTGMTPEIAIRSREFKRERDYWKKEALKWASELGEQKLERGKNEGN